MRTITFYSYKGGVGRSLALSNIATRLSEYNKKVCVIDFDIEAPGMHFKFKNFTKSINIKKGLVDYIHGFACEENISKKIMDYTMTLIPTNKVYNPIYLIPAGNIDNPEYWKKLSSINWADMFYSKSGQGVNFFLDLKAKIQKEINPDFLLIDSRTGITDISGITLKLLAEEVVILAANNEENIDGSKKIIKSLIDPAGALLGNIPKITFLLTRLPFTDAPDDRKKEYSIVEKRKQEFKKYLKLENFEITVIHSDRSLEEDEKQLIGYEYEEKNASISNDYLKLFEILTENVLKEDEIKEFQNKKNAEKEYIKARNEKDLAKKLQHINKAIELDANKYEYIFERGVIHYNLNNFTEAEKDILKANELSPDNPGIIQVLGILYIQLEKYEKAIEYLDRSIKLYPSFVGPYRSKSLALTKQKKYNEALATLNEVLDNIDPNNDLILNTRADLYRILGDYTKGYHDIYKAIELNSEFGVYFATLAELYAMEGKNEEFYLNFSIALSKNVKPIDIRSAIEVYQKFQTDPRFLSILAKSGIDPEEVFITE